MHLISIIHKKLWKICIQDDDGKTERELRVWDFKRNFKGTQISGLQVTENLKSLIVNRLIVNQKKQYFRFGHHPEHPRGKAWRPG